jgi:tRNA A37 N6-isopentenylltransferase MiaA
LGNGQTVGRESGYSFPYLPSNRLRRSAQEIIFSSFNFMSLLFQNTTSSLEVNTVTYLVEHQNYRTAVPQELGKRVSAIMDEKLVAAVTNL